MGYLMGYDDDMGDVLADVRRERFRQEDLKRQGEFPYSCADVELAGGDKLGVLMEEVGEAATALLQTKNLNSAHDSKRELRKELVQVAAVAVAWIESLDKEAREARIG